MADFSVDTKLIYDEKEKEVVFFVGSSRCVLLKADVPTENGNIYTEEALKNMVEEAKNDKIQIKFKPMDLRDKDRKGNQ